MHGECWPRIHLLPLRSHQRPSTTSPPLLLLSIIASSLDYGVVLSPRLATFSRRPYNIALGYPGDHHAHSAPTFFSSSEATGALLQLFSSDCHRIRTYIPTLTSRSSPLWPPQQPDQRIGAIVHAHLSKFRQLHVFCLPPPFWAPRSCPFL